jgi:hypothetical protein
LISSVLGSIPRVRFVVVDKAGLLFEKTRRLLVEIYVAFSTGLYLYKIGTGPMFSGLFRLSHVGVHSNNLELRAQSNNQIADVKWGIE